MAMLRSSQTKYASPWLRIINWVHTSTGVSSTLLSPHIPIEEETIPGYNHKNFFPASPGDILNNRYRMVAKLGWGTTSTVWLAQDIQRRRWWESNRYVAIKLAVHCFADDSSTHHELRMTELLGKTPSHNGFDFVRGLVDSFEAVGPEGNHLCLVYEPMREPLWLFQKRLPHGKIPPALLKVYLGIFLQALDYLHSDCHIIHTGKLHTVSFEVRAIADFITDLKLDNLLVGFEHPSVLADYVAKQAANPMPRKSKNGRSIYLSHNDFGPMKSFKVLPKIADFGLAQPIDKPDALNYPIQAPLFHAPEVLLGTGWSYSADIWNLGILVWNMLEGVDLFKHIRSSAGQYDARAHIAEMIALLGPPPKELINREKLWSKAKWDKPIPDLDGKLCNNSREYFSGPFFNTDGDFMHNHLIPTDLTLGNTVTSLHGDEKELFLSFAKKMLQWLPEDRQTAKELLQDPWLAS